MGLYLSGLLKGYENRGLHRFALNMQTSSASYELHQVLGTERYV